MQYKYYHNPKCSKSRQGLEFIKNLGIDFQIKEYLKEQLSSPELIEIFTKLAIPADMAIRKKETVYKDLKLDERSLSNQEWAEIIIKNPTLLERPILVGQKIAKIGRPTEQLKDAIHAENLR